MRREIGIYYLTEDGKKMLSNVPIININDKIFITATSDEVYMVTLGRKMRLREFTKKFLKELIKRKCLNRSEIRSSPDRRLLMSAMRLFRLLRMARYRDDKICIEPKPNILRVLGLA